MWWAQPKQATSATMAIVYITVGALMDVWTVIYYIYLNRHETDDNTFLWVYGFFFTGIVLMTIGFGLGAIGRSAKQAEVAPPPPQINSGVAGMPAAAPTATQPIVVAVPAAPVAPASAAPAPSVSTRPAPTRR